MGKAFSEDLKWRIIYTWLDGLSVKHISKLFYISEKTIYRVIKYYKLWNNVKDLKERNLGKKKIFNNSDIKVCTYLFSNIYYFILY